MNKTHLLIAVLCAASFAHAQTFQGYATEKLTQRAQQLAVDGAKQARAAYEKAGLNGVAKASDACLSKAKTGQVSSHQCLGIEAAAMTFRKMTPRNRNTQTALDWFSDSEMTNRAYGHCFSSLGIRSDMGCAMAFRSAKVAADSVLVSTSDPFKGDLKDDLAPGSTKTAAAHGDDQLQTDMKSAAAIMVIAYRQGGIDGVIEGIENCDRRAKGDEKTMCTLMDGAGKTLSENFAAGPHPAASYFGPNALMARITERAKIQGALTDEHHQLTQRNLRAMKIYTEDALRSIP